MTTSPPAGQLQPQPHPSSGGSDISAIETSLIDKQKALQILSRSEWINDMTS